MCGISGFFSLGAPRTSQTAVALAVLAHGIEERGEQSWGCTDGESVLRSVGKISKNFSVPEVIPESFAMHTRYATTGKIKEDNSHPFVIRENGRPIVVGMHNGIISNHAEMNSKYARKYRVDSQHIFGHIANDLPLTELSGYGTIVYKKDDSWYIGTFNGGELAVSRTKLGLFFASTVHTLDRALMAAGLYKDAEDLNLEDDVIYKVTDKGLVVDHRLNVQYTFKRWDDGKKSALSTDFEVDWNRSGDCKECGDMLPLDHSSSFCERCKLEYEALWDETDNPNWSVEVMPEGMTIMCESCGSHLNSGDSVAIAGDVYVCLECMNDWDKQPGEFSRNQQYPIADDIMRELYKDRPVSIPVPLPDPDAERFSNSSYNNRVNDAKVDKVLYGAKLLYDATKEMV